MRWFGFFKHGYYKAGHAALVLVNHVNGECKYYDFGRYHTPLRQGRVRSYETDPERKINTKAIIKNKKIENMEELLTELQTNSSCHGEGRLLASTYHHIELPLAIETIASMQNQGSIGYGPFRYQGSNCSRFVAKIAKSSSRNCFI